MVETYFFDEKKRDDVSFDCNRRLTVAWVELVWDNTEI